MVFFGSVLKIANYSGILVSLHDDHPHYKLLTFFSCSCVLNMVFHTAYFYIENIKDFDLSTSVLGALITVVMHLFKVEAILNQNKLFMDIYLKIKGMAEEDTDRIALANLEKTIERVARAFLSLVAVLLISLCTTPPLVQLIEYLETGSISKYRWELPLPYANPFVNLASSPAYEITFIIFVVTVTPLAMLLVSPDLLFMATCMHIEGLWHLVIIKAKDFIVNPNDADSLRILVDYQNRIYEIIQETKQVFGRIFFVQSLGTLVIACTQIYVATQVG